MGVGRKRKPTALKIAEGNPGHEVLPDNEPQFKSVCPDPPKGLGSFAKKEWKAKAPMLSEQGLLTENVLVAFQRYCECHELVEKSYRALKKEGLTQVAGNGTIIPNPNVAIFRQATKECRAYENEFGLTPASQSKVCGNKPKTGDSEMDLYFAKKKEALKRVK